MAKGKFEKWLAADGISKISEWASTGLTDAQISHNMGISVSTLNEWKRRFPQIMDALKKGKIVADQEVENSMYKSAIGYYVEEEVQELSFEAATGNSKLITTKHSKKWCPPSVTAQIFWLKNRQPDRWRDKVVQEVETSSGRNIGVITIPSRMPERPPQDIKGRQQLIDYYEAEIQRESQQDNWEHDS